MTSPAALLEQVRARRWFYEFELPDGTKTSSFVPAHALPIHTSRRDKLFQVIEKYVPVASRGRALDLACHEGYYSVALAKYFQQVDAFELRPQTAEAARLIIAASGLQNVRVHQADIRSFPLSDDMTADFVLVYGLIYHVEDPIGLVRLVSKLSRKHVLIESQVLPLELTLKVEDGTYQGQRDIAGLLGIAPDNPISREGGATNLALVPSAGTIAFLLRHFGFDTVEIVSGPPDDFEQFTRGHRVVIYGAK